MCVFVGRREQTRREEGTHSAKGSILSSWFRGPGFPRVVLLVDKARAQGSQGWCWVLVGRLCPDTARCRTAVVLGLMSTHWWVGLGPEASGYRALGVMKLVLACWWVGWVLTWQIVVL